MKGNSGLLRDIVLAGLALLQTVSLWFMLQVINVRQEQAVENQKILDIKGELKGLREEIRAKNK